MHTCRRRLLSALLLSAAATAQQTPAEKAQKPVIVYRVDFTLRDSEPGQKPAARHYSMLLEDTGQGRINTGGRVPVPTSSFQPGVGGQGISPVVSTQYQFFEVGVNLQCQLRERGDYVILGVEVGISDVLTDKQATPGLPPKTNQERAQASAAVMPGKPTVILTWDGAGTRRHFELEATAVKVK